MEDNAIVALFFARSEDAISSVEATYGPLLHRLAANILGDGEDARECVNDTYLALWNTIPPQRPAPLSAFACAVCRNLALKRRRFHGAQKRRRSMEQSMEELSEIFSSPSAEEQWSAEELSREIDRFLARLEPAARALFLRRYYMGDSIEELSRAFRISKNNVSVRLSRLRDRLRHHLQEEGSL